MFFRITSYNVCYTKLLRPIGALARATLLGFRGRWAFRLLARALGFDRAREDIRVSPLAAEIETGVKLVIPQAAHPLV